MALPSFRKLVTSDTVMSRLQDTLATIFSWIGRREILDGILLKGVSIATSPTAVDHGLGRAAEGFIPVRSNASATIYQVSATDRTLNLQASSAVIVDLWVF